MQTFQPTLDTKHRGTKLPIAITLICGNRSAAYNVGVFLIVNFFLFISNESCYIKRNGTFLCVHVSVGIAGQQPLACAGYIN